MDNENFGRIAGFFNLPGEPAPADEGDGVFVVRAASSPAVEAPPGAPPLDLAVEALGGSAAECLAAYRRLVVLRAAQRLAAVRDAASRTRAFTLRADDAAAAIEAERAAP